MVEALASQPGRERLELVLSIEDRETIALLLAIDDELERERHAAAALKIGVLAMQRASSELDGTKLRREGERLISELELLLARRANDMSFRVEQAFRDYLDPHGGHLAHRLERLVANDGELANVLRMHVSGDQSEIARTLARHVGEHSPLFRWLDPEHGDGLRGQIARVLEQELTRQRERLLEQFSLDREDSALSRLVVNIKSEQSRLRSDFQDDVKRMVAQFSLDDDSSALSRLVRQVHDASSSIVQQFSLDTDASALSRLRRELTEAIVKLDQQQQRFHVELAASLAASTARRQAETQGPQHGLEFEDKLSAMLETYAARAGDLFEACGRKTGAIPNCKKGDQLVELGPDHTCSGRRIVFEAKRDHGFDDRHAREEIELARKNRSADVGVFVFSRAIAGGKPPLRRFGDDLLVVWDHEDPTTDVYLEAAWMAAHAMVHQRHQNVADAFEAEIIERAINTVEKEATKLDEIESACQAIVGKADGIRKHTETMRKSLARQVEQLRTQFDAVCRA